MVSSVLEERPGDLIDFDGLAHVQGHSTRSWHAYYDLRHRGRAAAALIPAQLAKWRKLQLAAASHSHAQATLIHQQGH